jgi:hypothetical protein
MSGLVGFFFLLVIIGTILQVSSNNKMLKTLLPKMDELKEDIRELKSLLNEQQEKNAE